jgi:hypothetical protein
MKPGSLGWMASRYKIQCFACWLERIAKTIVLCISVVLQQYLLTQTISFEETQYTPWFDLPLFRTFSSALPSANNNLSQANGTLPLKPMVRPCDKWMEPVRPYYSLSTARGPCPMMNTLANHGFLHRDGLNLTEDVVIKALQDGLNFDTSLSETMFKMALPANPDPNATWFTLYVARFCHALAEYTD